MFIKGLDVQSLYEVEWEPIFRNGRNGSFMREPHKLQNGSIKGSSIYLIPIELQDDDCDFCTLLTGHFLRS